MAAVRVSQAASTVQRDAGLQYRDCTQDSLDSTVDRLAGNQDDSPPEAEDVDTDGAGEGRCVAECGLEGEGGGVGGGGGKFTLGAEDGAELIEEFSFTLKYCQEAGPAELAGELERLQSAGPPPPGHWAGAPRGPAQVPPHSVHCVLDYHRISCHFLARPDLRKLLCRAGAGQARCLGTARAAAAATGGRAGTPSPPGGTRTPSQAQTQSHRCAS